MTMVDTKRHYDLLIDEGNDPVHDPEELQAYMDCWDGECFMSLLGLDGTQSVLEIGVGTGRLARRIAPRCRCFTGIDLSPKTIARAGENLARLAHVDLVCGDFLTADLHGGFDVICSSLTFMHIRRKDEAIARIAALLVPGGRVVLSLDKNQDPVLDYGARTLRVYPDQPDSIAALMEATGLYVDARAETEFAWIIAAQRR